MACFIYFQSGFGGEVVVLVLIIISVETYDKRSRITKMGGCSCKSDRLLPIFGAADQSSRSSERLWSMVVCKIRELEPSSTSQL